MARLSTDERATAVGMLESCISNLQVCTSIFEITFFVNFLHELFKTIILYFIRYPSI